MTILHSPSIVTSGLELNLDVLNAKSNSGLVSNIATELSPRGIADNGTTFRFSTGTETVNIPTVGVIQNCNYVDMYNDYNGGSGACCPSPYGYGNGIPVTGSTLYTYGILYKSTNRYTHPNWMYHYEYTSGSSYITEYGVHGVGGYSAIETHLGDDWYWSRAIFTTNANAATINTGSWMYQYATWNRFHVAKILIAPGNHLNLHPRYWPNVNTSGGVLYNTVGSSNASLVGGPVITSTNNSSILLDGVDDYAQVTIPTTTARTIEIVYKLYNPGSGWGPLWRVDDWRERIFPSSINLIPDSGTYYYLNGPSGSTSLEHIVYSYNGTSAKSYLNGQLQSNITMDSTMQNSTFSYRFGNQSGGSSNAYVNMDLYLVRFYNRQLTDLEVQQNFNSSRSRLGL